MRPRHALSLVPLAIGVVNQAVRIPSAPVAPVVMTDSPTAGGATKEFSIPLSNLKDWAQSVVVSLGNLKIEGNSAVHALEDDCEMHFGAHTPEFQGNPDGLVLEPMNTCVEVPPDPFDTWPAFAKSIKGKTITAVGVPRIWPEHLNGGTASNPDHASELHPLTGIEATNGTFDFAQNIFAGEYHGKDGNRGIAGRVRVSVKATASSADITFQGGQIGNFTTLDLLIDRASITSDSTGSFRMNGDVALNSSTRVPVRIVTVKGSAINDSVIAKIKTHPSGTESMEGALVLYSLSPESLLEAATKSNGKAISAVRPIQLILYGIPDSE